MSPARERAALAVILAVGAALRFGAHDRQGLLFFDEGQMIMEAGQMRELVAGWWRTATAPPERRAATRAELGDAIRGCRIVFGKPGHNLALAAALSAQPEPRRATLLVSALAGTLTVAALWLAARRWWGAPAALAGALLLALSPYHLLYSREGLSDALTVFWLAGAIAVPAGRGGAAAITSGLLAGCAVTTNYRELFLPAVFAALIWLDAAGTGWTRLRAASGRWAVWLAGFAAPLLLCEALYQAIRAAAGPGAEFPGGTYLDQLRELLAFHGGQGFLWAGWAAFPAHVLRWEGIVSLAVLAAVLPWQLRRWRGPDAGANVLLLAPWLLFSAYWDNAPRFFAILLPVAAAIKGRWLLEAGRRWLPAAAVSAPLLAIAALALPRAIALVPRPTPYHEAATLIAGGGDPRHLSTNARLGAAYFGPGATAPVPPSDAGLAEAGRAGWRWVVVDLQMYFGGFDRPAERIATIERLAATRQPVLDLAYPPDALAQYVLEQDLSFADARDMLRRMEALAPRLRVYDLRSVR